MSVRTWMFLLRPFEAIGDYEYNFVEGNEKKSAHK
jgi:hypothetical protein